MLLAFGQVADVLQALQHDAELLGAENTAVTTSDASLEARAGRVRRAGRGSLLQVLDAQRLYEQALLGYAHAKGQRYLDTILLFEAMGGDSQAWVEALAEQRRSMTPSTMRTSVGFRGMLAANRERSAS